MENRPKHPVKMSMIKSQLARFGWFVVAPVIAICVALLVSLKLQPKEPAPFQGFQDGMNLVAENAKETGRDIEATILGRGVEIEDIGFQDKNFAKPYLCQLVSGTRKVAAGGDRPTDACEAALRLL